ncbi:MAG: hypothetical protein SCAL_000282 [Candidatus Syntrophoarchaeum caldarius]|uniref:Uncharacterized protein n=1 Tax=Candidatus Syntropharchaeum caldarium TaxID=1838285 RepID=A0A1F2PD87_9EURY|nr:MAG: hypothetical protein SCAL_000282 [Candidatus Syntrophoarchaeum caldarius]
MIKREYIVCPCGQEVYIVTELEIGKELGEKIEKSLDILKGIAEKVELPKLDKEKFEEAIDLVKEAKEALDIPGIKDMIGLVEGKRIEAKLSFDKLTLDGAIRIDITPIKEEEK